MDTAAKEGAEKSKQEYLSEYPISDIGSTKFPQTFEDLFIIGYVLDDEFVPKEDKSDVDEDNDALDE